VSYIIDRRLNSKKKSTVNRQRFLQRTIRAALTPESFPATTSLTLATKSKDLLRVVEAAVQALAPVIAAKAWMSSFSKSAKKNSSISCLKTTAHCPHGKEQAAPQRN